MEGHSRERLKLGSIIILSLFAYLALIQENELIWYLSTHQQSYYNKITPGITLDPKCRKD